MKWVDRYEFPTAAEVWVRAGRSFAEVEVRDAEGRTLDEYRLEGDPELPFGEHVFDLPADPFVDN